MTPYQKGQNMKTINPKHLTSAQFRRLADIKEQIAALEFEFNTIATTGTPVSMPEQDAHHHLRPLPKRRRMSAAARAKISAAAKKRWRKARAQGLNSL